MPPLMRRESAAMPAIPSPGSRSCRNEAPEGVMLPGPPLACRGQLQLAQQQQQPPCADSGCELCRIMRAVGDVVTKTGGGKVPPEPPA